MLKIYSSFFIVFVYANAFSQNNYPSSGDAKINNLFLGRYGYSLAGDTNPYTIYSDDGEEHDLTIYGGSSSTLHLRLYDGNLKMGSGQTPTTTIFNNGNANFGGRIAIGITTPYLGSGLHVKSPSSGPWGIVSEAVSNQRIIGLGHNGIAGIVSVSYLDVSGYSPLYFETSNLTRLAIKVDGKVGIGTTSPDQLLTVNGTIHSKEVKVDLAVPAPDYVFEKDYKLPSLDEIKTYIDRNKHLPDVPSAKEMEANGVQLGEMNMVLLKKIEELTLYMIDARKEIEDLKSENKKIKELILK